MRAYPPAGFAPILASLMFTGCAESGAYPSLAPRAAEERHRIPQKPISQPIVAADEALQQRLATLRAKAQEGEAFFRRMYAQLGPMAAAAGPPQSESWVEAQQALSRLEGARTDTVFALAELDALAISISESRRPLSDDDRAALATTLQEVNALAERQRIDAEAVAGLLSR